MNQKQTAAGLVRSSTPRRQRLRKNWMAIPPMIPCRPFIDYAWENFDPRAVAAYLIDEDKGFYHKKKILYEGFCAWVVCPSRKKLRQDAMMYRIAKAVDAAEAPWREKAGGFIHTLGESVGRLLNADRRFFEEVYYPAGGSLRILQAQSRAAFKITLAKNATEILEAVHVMAIYHFHLTNLPGNKYSYALGKETGGAAAGPIFGKRPIRLFVEDIEVRMKKGLIKDTTIIIYTKNKVIKNEKYIRVKMDYKIRSVNIMIESWDKSRPSIAYAYAAASICTGPNRTLLHELIANKSSYTIHRHHMLEWCGRARYVLENIISRLNPEKGKPERNEAPFDFQTCVLPVKPIEFQPPALFALSTKKLVDEYTHQSRQNAETRQKKNL